MTQVQPADSAITPAWSGDAARVPNLGLLAAPVASVLIGARNAAEIDDAIRLRELAIPARQCDVLAAGGDRA